MEDINVEFQASNPRSVKLLDKLYDGHLVLNDIGFRLNEQLSGDGEITVPNDEDVQNLNDTFKKAVDTFTQITEEYGDVNQFAENFFGDTKTFAEAVITEMVDFNNGIADIASVGLESYDDEKLNDWINKMMGEVVDTNEAFNKLIGEE